MLEEMLLEYCFYTGGVEAQESLHSYLVYTLTDYDLAQDALEIIDYDKKRGIFHTLQMSIIAESLYILS